MLRPTVAVICVVAALAVCGHIRPKISPTTRRAAAARTLITVLHMVASNPSGVWNHLNHKKLKLRRTLIASQR
jgi:hypothetical protein